jgi:hypothetical protein
MSSELLPFIFAGVLVVLTLVMIVVGVYLILLLKEIRFAVIQVQAILARSEQAIMGFAQPFQQITGISAGLHTGFKVFEGFLQWLEKSRRS